MVPRNERFQRGHELPRNSRTTLGAFFRVRSAPNSLQRNRFAVVTPKTIDSRAVVRNRIRRIAYETVRSWPKCGRDIVITATKAAVGRPKRELVSDLLQIRKNIIPPQVT